MQRGDKVPVLNHGYVAYINHMAEDSEIIEDARMSTAKGFLGWGGDPCPECNAAGRLWHRDKGFVSYEDKLKSEGCRCKGTGKVESPGDEKLLRFLRENRHTTPFEGCVLKVEVQAPIMVFREWHRHRTQSYSEMSARYTPLPDLNYVPTVERLMLNSKTNKQAGVVKGSDELTAEDAEKHRQELIEEWDRQQAFYLKALQRGVPKELARLHLGVGRYSRMRATANLKNWLDFMTLRSDFTESGKKAQWEIRMFANEVGKIIEQLFPRSWELFCGE